jgi:hypothetical protein
MMYFVLEMRRDSGIQKGRQGGGVIQSKDETEDEEPAGKTKIARQRKRSRGSNKQMKGERERERQHGRQRKENQRDRQRKEQRERTIVCTYSTMYTHDRDGGEIFFIYNVFRATRGKTTSVHTVLHDVIYVSKMTQEWKYLFLVLELLSI